MKHFLQFSPASKTGSLGGLSLLGWAVLGTFAPENALAQGQNQSMAPPTSVLISELRASGPNGLEDAFVELFNASSQPLSLAGWSLQIRDEKGALSNLKIAPDARIGARGHLLLTGRNYSLPSLARGDGILNAPIGGGIQLRNAKNQVVDAVGPDNAESAFREGAGLPAFAFSPASAKPATNTPKTGVAPTAIPQYSCVRKASDGEPQDTGNNAQDFTIVSVSGALSGRKIQIGTPGPENTASPRLRPRLTSAATAPNSNGAAAQVQPIALQTDPKRNEMSRARREVGPLKTFGTMTLIYQMVNTTPGTIKSLSFRVNSITSDSDPVTAPAGSADLRLIRGKATPSNATAPKPVSDIFKTSPQVGANPKPVQRTVWVWKAKISPVPVQPLGGALNALLNVDLPATGIAPGARGEIWFSFGVERAGNYRVVLSNQSMNIVFEGNTEADLEAAEAQPPGTNGGRPQTGTSLAQNGGAANDNSNTGGQNANVAGTDPVADPANQPQEAPGLVFEGNTEDGVTPPPPLPVKPSAKSS